MVTKNPLEWVTDRLERLAGGAPGAALNGRIQLLLDRDEVADIYKVEVNLFAQIPVNVSDSAETQQNHAYAISTDPRIDNALLDDTTAHPLAIYEDRNIFAMGFFGKRNEFIAGADGEHTLVMDTTFSKAHEFKEPLTVGGDIGWVFEQEPDDLQGVIVFLATVYFRRRKSKNEKSNLIMLRR